MSVAQDPASRKYVPASTSEWTELLTGLGINAPSSFWLCQETSGNLADSGSGGRTVTVSGSPAYAQTAPGWIRKGITPTDGSLTQTAIATIPNVNANSGMLLQMFSVTTVGSATRDVNHIGGASAENAQMLAANKLRASSGVNTAIGVQQHIGPLVMITKFDRANSVLGVYTQHEQLKPTFVLPSASTDLYLFGGSNGCCAATLVYAAFWTGADAEISDAKIQDILDAIDGEELTIEKMEAGSFNHKWVVEIEGCKYRLSDAPAAAVLNAYAGRDGTEVLGGLFVEVNNDQRIKPFQAFAEGGTATIRVVDTDRSDVFGKYVWRRAGGDETCITSTVDRNDTTINVKSTAQFDSSGEIYIGTECIGYTGVTATSFTGCTRGKYSPFGCDISGSGGVRFGNHHRVGTDVNHVQMNPVVSSIPRVWLGKRVAIRLHTWDAVNQTINARAEAQLVFAGRITDIGDDPNDAHTVIECDHVLSELLDTTIMRDPLVAEAAPGIALIEGRTFAFTEGWGESAANVANALTVVAGAPANTNQITAGTYSGQEVCDALNRWLGGELAAARLVGYFSWSISSNTDGIRTRCHWKIPNASNTHDCGFNLGGPAEVMSFLGLSDAAPDLTGGMVTFGTGTVAKTNAQVVSSGIAVPFTTLVFRPFAGRLGLEFSDSTYIDASNVRGTFVDQRTRLPAAIRGSCDPTTGWGLFLLDEKVLCVASYDTSIDRLRNIWVSPFQMPGANDGDVAGYFGRRADEPDAGPVAIRQILLIEGSFAQLMLELMHSTGVAGYNHATYDTLGFGLGVGLPGELLGPEFERSLWNLPTSGAPLVLLIDEPTTLRELIGADLMFRWAFVRWKDQHLEIANWKTPLNDLAVTTLSESNKAVPVGSEGENHRVASVETSEHQYAIVKIDYNRNFAVGRNGDYLKEVQFEDQTAVDDSGGASRTATLKLRNTFTQYTNTGNSVEQGLLEFMVHMPSISRTSRKIGRTLTPTLFESIAPGDIITLNDNFARDPLTGARGVNSRAAFVYRVAYDIGGPEGGDDGDVRPIDGEIAVNFLDTQRGQTFAPAGDINETVTGGGFDAGYNSGVPSIRLHEHHYSHVITVPFGRGTFYLTESADAANFVAGDKILIVERDPANPASVTSWERTILSVSGNDITLTSTLSSPAWDNTKRYRVVPQRYSQVQSTQKDAAFQADDADEMVEDVEIPWHYSATEEALDFADYSFANEPAEFVANLCYGDGRPYDVGHEQAMARFINAYHDYKSAHQAPCLNDQLIGLYDEATVAWFTMFFGPIFLSTEHLSATVTRSLTVAPWFRSQNGNAAKLRITIMRSPPVGANIGFLPGEQYRNSVFNDHYSQSAEYSTLSTTWQTGADAVLSLDVKDIWFGFVWILIEGQGDIESRGLAKCIEGPRVVS